MLQRTTLNYRIKKTYNKKKETNISLLFKHSKHISILVSINTNQMAIKIKSRGHIDSIQVKQNIPLNPQNKYYLSLLSLVKFYPHKLVVLSKIKKPLSQTYKPSQLGYFLSISLPFFSYSFPSSARISKGIYRFVF